MQNQRLSFNLDQHRKALDQAYVEELRQCDLALWKLDRGLVESELLCLVATLQLAMRHPTFPSRPTGKWCAAFLEQLLRAIPKERPALRALMEAGNQPAFDEIQPPSPNSPPPGKA